MHRRALGEGTDWLERLDGEQLTLRKREFGRLSKKKQTMKTRRTLFARAASCLFIPPADAQSVLIVARRRSMPQTTPPTTTKKK